MAPTSSTSVQQNQYAPTSVAQPKFWQLWYDQLIDWMLANPGKSEHEAAKAVGKTVVYVRMIMRSDSFRARLAVRRDKIEEAIHDQVTRGLGTVATLGLEILADKLRTQRTNIPIQVVSNITDQALANLGYGAKQAALAAPAAVNVQVNVGAPSAAVEAARDKLRQIEAAKLDAPREPVSRKDARNPSTELGGAVEARAGEERARSTQLSALEGELLEPASSGSSGGPTASSRAGTTALSPASRFARDYTARDEDL